MEYAALSSMYDVWIDMYASDEFENDVRDEIALNHNSSLIYILKRIITCIENMIYVLQMTLLGKCAF